MEKSFFVWLFLFAFATAEINAYLLKEKNLRTYLNGVLFKECNDYFAIPQTQIYLSAGPDGVDKMKKSVLLRSYA